jgi:hypothetical protein
MIDNILRIRVRALIQSLLKKIPTDDPRILEDLQPDILVTLAQLEEQVGPPMGWRWAEPIASIIEGSPFYCYLAGEKSYHQIEAKYPVQWFDIFLGNTPAPAFGLEICSLMIGAEDLHRSIPRLSSMIVKPGISTMIGVCNPTPHDIYAPSPVLLGYRLLPDV